MIQGGDAASFFVHRYQVVLAPFVEKANLSPMNFLDTFVEIQLIIKCDSLFWNPNSILLKIYADPMIVPHCFDSVVLQ